MTSLSARIYATPFTGAVLAVVFAALCTAVQYAEVWSDAWMLTEGAPAPVTLRLPPRYFRLVLQPQGERYVSGQLPHCPTIVPRGRVLSPGSECAGLVVAFEEERRSFKLARMAASLALWLALGLLASRYMRKAGMGRARWLRSQIGIFALLALLAAGTKGILLFTILPFEALPVSAAPMLVAVFLGQPLALGAALIAALLIAALLDFNVQALLVFLAAGLCAVMALRALNTRRRVWSLFRSGAATALATMVAAALATLLFAGVLNLSEGFRFHLDPQHSIWIGSLVGGIGSGIIAIALLPVGGAIFSQVSRARLVNLQDLDHPLLKQVRERAPNTWEHCRAMANLAEAAAHAIGANSMLARVGAYFHDVGKSLTPEYFSENQRHGDNPHDRMAPHDSARTIFGHVAEGTRLLRKAGVPEDVVEFAYTHHGTSMLEYFWDKNLRSGNLEQFGEQDFSYPGQRPTSPETAILMIVDAVEAAARTIDAPEKGKFEALVQRIVFSKMAQGQFDESGLTMHQLRVIVNTIVDTLVSMYHARIKYPWQQPGSGEGDKTPSA